MNIQKNSILFFISILVLILSSTILSAADSKSDPTGDVAHWSFTAGHWGWSYNVGNKPDIDITELSYTVNGDQLTLTLKVAGTIQNSEVTGYWAYLNTSDATYWMSWSNNTGGGLALSLNEESMNYDWEPEITVSGNTLSCTFDVVGTDYTNTELWGWAAEYITLGDTTQEWWGDWAPNEHAPFYGEDTSGDGDDSSTDDGGANGAGNDSGKTTPSDGGTPGFESITVIAAIALSLLVLKKRKK